MAPTTPRKAARKASPKVAVRDESLAWEPVPTPEAAAPLAAPQAGDSPGRARVHEPVWLVRIVLVLFLVGFSAFLAREVSNFLTTLP
ncbi:MAG: hypothetical protein AABY18_08935 [Candidatus Thermoplasmatota archaeon]